jgi:hypothetical protein
MGPARQLASSVPRHVVELLVLTADDIEDLQIRECRVLGSALICQLCRAHSQAPCFARCDAMSHDTSELPIGGSTDVMSSE